MPKILILGISHVHAIAAALTAEEAQQVQVANVRTDPNPFSHRGTRFLGVDGTWPTPIWCC